VPWWRGLVVSSPHGSLRVERSNPVVVFDYKKYKLSWTLPNVYFYKSKWAILAMTAEGNTVILGLFGQPACMIVCTIYLYKYIYYIFLYFLDTYGFTRWHRRHFHKNKQTVLLEKNTRLFFRSSYFFLPSLYFLL
jgi:hypothetical protein